MAVSVIFFPKKFKFLIFSVFLSILKSKILKETYWNSKWSLIVTFSFVNFKFYLFITWKFFFFNFYFYFFSKTFW